MLMVALVKRGDALDYPLCDQTVTVYHLDGNAVTRTVHERAFLDFRKAENVAKTGSKDASSFLLVIPGDGSPVSEGDKVMLGEGPEAVGIEGWRNLIPSKVPGLVVVSYVDAKHFRGKKVHTEAGG